MENFDIKDGSLDLSTEVNPFEWMEVNDLVREFIVLVLTQQLVPTQMLEAIAKVMIDADRDTMAVSNTGWDKAVELQTEYTEVCNALLDLGGARLMDVLTERVTETPSSIVEKSRSRIQYEYQSLNAGSELDVPTGGDFVDHIDGEVAHPSYFVTGYPIPRQVEEGQHQHWQAHVRVLVNSSGGMLGVADGWKPTKKFELFGSKELAPPKFGYWSTSPQHKFIQVKDRYAIKTQDAMELREMFLQDIRLDSLTKVPKKNRNRYGKEYYTYTMHGSRVKIITIRHEGGHPTYQAYKLYPHPVLKESYCVVFATDVKISYRK